MARLHCGVPGGITDTSDGHASRITRAIMRSASAWLTEYCPAITRTCAAYAIARLQSPEARAVLERIQQDKELAVRNAAARALRDWPA